MEDIIYLSCKNKYGYTKKQLKINYKEKTYKVGNFKIMRANSTAKEIDKKVEWLKQLGFEEEK